MNQETSMDRRIVLTGLANRSEHRAAPEALFRFRYVKPPLPPERLAESFVSISRKGCN